MKRAVMLRSLLIALAALLISGIVSTLVLQRQYTESKSSEMREILNVMTIADKNEDYGTLAKHLSKLAPDYLRVTFIAQDGTVLGDSDADPAKMENHKGRPEVKAAMENGYGEDIRHSATVGIDMMYAAKKLPNGTVLRLAENLKGINAHIWTLMPGLLFGILLAMIITPFLAWQFSKAIVKPLGEVAGSLKSINAGKYGNDISLPAYDEFVPLVNEINMLSKKISGTLGELKAERLRISYLLNNMNEGLVVLDSAQRILIINRSASAFFSAPADIEGKNLLCLTHVTKVSEAVSFALNNGEPAFFDLSLPDSRVLQIFVSPVTGSEDDEYSGGVIMLITDVTAIRKSEQIRSEFVANASHELKTPLTSIKGFAELIETGIVNDPKVTKRYLGLIRGETERMITLINDILKLSELESNNIDTGKSSVNLMLIAQEVKESLSPQAQEKDVTVNIEGDNVFIDANPDRMTQLILNLLDNAIKYNVPGGKADIIIRQDRKNVIIKVSDTGIGIPEEAQERIFERFYRVDKSHSRKIGGTGLGLSIVKHIVALYKGKISLKSKEDTGTAIEVTLPL